MDVVAFEASAVRAAVHATEPVATKHRFPQRSPLFRVRASVERDKERRKLVFLSVDRSHKPTTELLGRQTLDERIVEHRVVEFEPPAGIRHGDTTDSAALPVDG